MKIRAALLICTLTSHALADPPAVETIPAGDDQIVVVRAGEKVPFTGQLFDSSTALRWANWLQQYRLLLPTVIDHDEKTCAVKLQYDATVLATSQKQLAFIEQDLNKRLAASEKQRAQAEYEAQNPPWYRTVLFGAGIGIVATLAVTYTVVRTTK